MLLQFEPMKALGTLGTISPRDMGERSQIRKNGMKFDLKSYTVEGVGYLSTIDMTAFLGLMKMESLIFTPLDMDMPLMSYDYIKAFGKDTLIMELYDTQLEPFDVSAMDAVKAKYAALPDRTKEPDWSDSLRMSPSFGKVGKGLAGQYARLAGEWTDAYVTAAKAAPRCEREAKRTATKGYTDKLFRQGGPAVNQFKKMLGDGPAIDLLGRFIFSCDAE